MTQIYFVTGTDTDAGKTLTVAALLENVRKRGKVALGFKPVASGLEILQEGLCNKDVISIQKHNSYPLKYDECVGYQFDEAVAPHIAACSSGTVIDTGLFDEGINHLLDMNPDYLFIEGAGGWMLPLGPDSFMSQWVSKHQYPVIITVGVCLGCLNHAVMTQRLIENMGCKVAGYVLNQVFPGLMHYQDNISWLKEYFSDIPCLGEIPFLERPYDSDLSGYLNTGILQ